MALGGSFIFKFLVGGSPCTYWSIAKTNGGRETAASGEGWELFLNYLIAKEKFNPDYFLYENNYSISKEIKEQITKALGVEPIMINSALVSAQNRKRCYWTNIPGVEEPEDRGILLQDVLESGLSACGDKSRCIDANYYKGGNLSSFERQSGKRMMVATQIRVGCLPNAKGEIKNSQSKRIYAINAKSATLQAATTGGGCSDTASSRTGLYAVPLEESNYEIIDGANVLVTDRAIRQGDKRGTKQGKYVYLPFAEKTNTISAGQAHNEKVLVPKPEGTWKTIYAVKDGQIEIKGKLYPIKLPDGSYIIRKLTVAECCRLQTLPDDYCRAVSNTQAYKGLGNGWTAEVIIHILRNALSDIPKDEEIQVLSMYDGIGTGRYCYDKLGFHNIRYFAYEIDKYARAISESNYPDIIQCGDAFQVREEGWENRFTFATEGFKVKHHNFEDSRLFREG